MEVKGMKSKEAVEIIREQSKTDKLKKELAEKERELSQLEEDIDIVKRDIDDIESDLDGIKKLDPDEVMEAYRIVEEESRWVNRVDEGIKNNVIKNSTLLKDQVDKARVLFGDILG